MGKYNLRVIKKRNADLQTMTRIDAKFQKDQRKTVGGVDLRKHVHKVWNY